MDLTTDGRVTFTPDEERRFAEELENPMLAALRDHWAAVERLTALFLGEDPED